MIVMRTLIDRFRPLMVILISMLVVLIMAGCKLEADRGRVSDEEAGIAQQASKSTPAPPEDPRWVPTCTNAGNHTDHNAGWPKHERGPCPAVDGHTFDDAVESCDASVKYYGYYCSDHLSGTHTWTVYYGCCAASCADGVQNQGETGIDCGGPCANACPMASLTLESSPSDTMYLGEGASQNLLTLFNLINTTGSAVTVQNQVTISPDDGGLTLTSDYPGGYSSAGSASFVLNQAVLANNAGSYVITNTGTIVGTSVQVTYQVVVNVIPPGGNPLIYPPGLVPNGIQINVPTEVTAAAGIAQFTIKPTTLSLRQVDGLSDPIVANLHDDGLNGDLLANDGIYSGRVTLTATTEAPLVLRVTGIFPGVPGERASNDAALAVTCHPTTLQPPDPANEVTDPETGEVILCNEIVVVFAQGATCADKDAVAALVGGTIAGSDPGLGLYQIGLPGLCSGQRARDAVNALTGRPLVQEVSPNFVGGLDEVVPNDANYALQNNLTRIRADEAWVIARGGTLIAVVDTGVDYNHEDLTGKIILGHDYVDGDEDPMDCHGHGTQVSSVAAANSNNGSGIAGVSWNSNVLALRALTCTGSITAANGAAAIRRAADLGARVINNSWSFSTSPAGLEAAVDYATGLGAIVVATAGNTGVNAVRFPCGYANTFCVGATTATDTRAGFSTFGAHVDISAPGVTIPVALNGGGYGTNNGTSFSAPTVSGSLAVVWSYFPTWTNAQVRTRLTTTAVPLPGLLIGPRVDLFEAVFNGSFEDETTGWTLVGTAVAPTALGPLTPQDRTRMGMISSGPDATVVESSLEQGFTIQPGVTNFRITFSYNFVTEEYPEWVGSIFNDNLRIVLVAPGGVETQLAYEDINTSSFSSIGGIDFPGGDSTVGHTGWRVATAAVPVTSGPGTYRIRVRDEGDGIFDSNVLIDHIRFR